MSRRPLLAMLLLILSLFIAACGPEDGRARGGGTGADIGNRPSTVTPPTKMYGVNPADTVYEDDDTDAAVQEDGDGTGTGKVGEGTEGNEGGDD